jgi:hypothetical protein
MKRNTIINPSRRGSLSPPRTEVNTARVGNRDYRNLVNATDYDNLVQNRSNAEIREILHDYRTANNIRPIVPIISRNFVDDIDLEVSGLTNSQITHAVRQGERSLRNRTRRHIRQLERLNTRRRIRSLRNLI